MSESRSWWSAIRSNRPRIQRCAGDSSTAASAVVSFTDITNVTTLLACRGTGLRTIVCERTDPRHHRIGRVWSWLRQRTVRHASVIVVQTASVRGWAESCGWKCPIAVIPNAAPCWTVGKSHAPNVERPTDDHRARPVVGRKRIPPAHRSFWPYCVAFPHGIW